MRNINMMRLICCLVLAIMLTDCSISNQKIQDGAFYATKGVIQAIPGADIQTAIKDDIDKATGDLKGAGCDVLGCARENAINLLGRSIGLLAGDTAYLAMKHIDAVLVGSTVDQLLRLARGLRDIVDSMPSDYSLTRIRLLREELIGHGTANDVKGLLDVVLDVVDIKGKNILGDFLTILTQKLDTITSHFFINLGGPGKVTADSLLSVGGRHAANLNQILKGDASFLTTRMLWILGSIIAILAIIAVIIMLIIQRGKAKYRQTTAVLTHAVEHMPEHATKKELKKMIHDLSQSAEIDVFLDDVLDRKKMIKHRQYKRPWNSWLWK